MLQLRPLDPTTERELFELAYNWRNRPKRHTQPDRMPFEMFAADDPKQVVMGLFNGELQAVYVFCEGERGHFDCHFTSSRNAPREWVIAGAQRMVDWFKEHGVIELTAYIVARNRPLRAFVELLGFTQVKDVSESPCQSDTPCSTIPPTATSRSFVKYVIRGEPPSG